jgi:L-Ala-D/L-Glu epimerase
MLQVKSPSSKTQSPLVMRTAVERWVRQTPLRIAGYVFDAVDTLLVTLEKDGNIGRGEAAGVYYRGDKPSSMAQQLQSVRVAIESGIDRESLRELLPPGGARNAVDCALWELESKLTGIPVWRLAGLSEPRPLLTTFTCGADEPSQMAARAQCFPNARAIKLKLTGEALDADRVRAVREALPNVLLAVDANQGFDRIKLERLMPVLVDSQVALIEQPFAVGQEELLDGFHSPIPIAADESVQSTTDLSQLVRRFSMVNIKLDKCGGLTEALTMARQAGELGLQTMVGNMMGTSLAMAPAFVVGQLCSLVDLDGPCFLQSDRPDVVQYADGFMTCSRSVWG